MGRQHDYAERASKKCVSDREMNASLLMLRALEAGLSVADLDYLSVGMVYDIMTERSYDDNGYVRKAIQKDFDRF